MAQELEPIDSQTALEIRGQNTIMSVQREELDMQIITAKAYPRDVAACKKNIKDCLDDLGAEVAEKMWYTHPYAKTEEGKPVEGPSVRMAELVLQNWPNMRVQARHVATNERDVISEAVAWDLEKNIAVTVQSVKSIMGKKGRYNDHLIANIAGVASSTAFRGVVFRVCPKSMIEEMTNYAKKLAQQSGNLPGRIKKMVDYFTKKGVPQEKLLARLGVKATSDITVEQLSDLRGMATAISDGDATIDDMFEMAHPQAKNLNDLADKMEKKDGDQPTQEEALPGV